MAVLFGSLIGFERQWLQRMAGLRTNSLVAVGFVVFSAMGSDHRRAPERRGGVEAGHIDPFTQDHAPLRESRRAAIRVGLLSPETQP